MSELRIDVAEVHGELQAVLDELAQVEQDLSPEYAITDEAYDALEAKRQQLTRQAAWLRATLNGREP